MNWITRKKFNKETDMLDQVCEHLAANPDLPGTTFIENDSFGYVGTSANCKDCAEKVIEQGLKKEVRCNDCSKMFLRGDAIEWVPYDYYPAQGDEPLFICHGCEAEERHQRRVEKDQKDYEGEIGIIYDDDSLYIDYD